MNTIKDFEKRDRIVAVITTALLFFAMIGVVYLHDSKQSLQDLLNGSKLKNEAMLSEKLALNKQVHDYKAQLAGLKSKNQELGKKMAGINDDLSRTRKELKDNTSPRVRSLERELAGLKKLRADLDGEMASLQQQLAQLENNNGDLTAQLAALTAKNRELSAQNEVMKAFAANNFEVEATRGKKDRSTVVARRAQQLKIGFDLPQNVAENVQFKIKTPGGKIVDKEEEGLTATMISPDDGSDLMASLAPLGDFEVTKRIELKYAPKKKLSKGTYVIDIYNGNEYMLSCQLKLR